MTVWRGKERAKGRKRGSERVRSGGREGESGRQILTGREGGKEGEMEEGREKERGKGGRWSCVSLTRHIFSLRPLVFQASKFIALHTNII